MATGNERRWQQRVASGERWDEEDAREALREWGSSGLSMYEFARRHGISSSQRLGWWRKRLSERERIVNPAVASSELAPLIPVTVAMSSGVTVEFGDVRVSISDPTTTPVSWVTELVKALRETSR